MKKRTIRNSIFPIIKSSDLNGKLLSKFKQNTTTHLQIPIYNSSFINLQASQIFKELNRDILLIFNREEEAMYALNEFENWFSKKKTLLFPASRLNPYQVEKVENANIVLRTEVLQNLQNEEPRILVTHAKALSEKLISKKSLSQKSFKIKMGDTINSDFLNELLFDYHFTRKDYVTEPGEFSLRGSILDVFSYSNEKPIRITFFGDEVEKLKFFDIENQRSTKDIEQFTLVPNIQNMELEAERSSLIKQLPQNAVVVMKEPDLIAQTIAKEYGRAQSIFKEQKGVISRSEPEKLFFSEQEFLNEITAFSTIEYSVQNSLFNTTEIIDYQLTEQPHFHKNFQLLAENLEALEKDGYKTYINCNSEKQAQRLHDIFRDIGHDSKFQALYSYIHEGFIDKEDKLALFTDHQIFDRYQSYHQRNRFSKSEALTLKELTQLKVGDYVTHIDHGVGKFMGLKKLKNDGKIQEAIKLVYQNGDILYVNIHSLHKITKHSSQGTAEPKVDKLGSKSWANRKNKTKKRVKELAFDLIQLYAHRKNKKGFEHEPDSYLQNELEASFMYEDTPDQEKATAQIKADMQSDKIMDRLICGDVGFGKTELAIRAAFKAVLSGKQVAILVPTTILAYQHYNTFKERLKDFPVEIDYLNRFRSSGQKKDILDKLSNGKLDIVIGTHQLAGDKIKFKDLGLLIIDEEHKFGVSVKDKLKSLKKEVDTLTLTATPIPRTMQFSLMAARDMSVLKTPPNNRQSVHTERIGFSEEIIRDGILRELKRGGQVFIINNRIENLQEVAGMVQRLVPEARIVIGHGQMDGKQLEKNLLDFINQKKDILIATSIIESGLDIPNANTIFINNAQQFGLADLHQMRGRVGRNNLKAYCYLIAPGNDCLTDEARKRLNAVETFTDLGAGFHIALKDLEIRGAGDILGPEQSGFISDVGFDAYQKIMNEAVNELKHNEFKELFDSEEASNISDIQLETDLEVVIPDHYINDVEVRLEIYQRLSQIESNAELEDIEVELVDRFGPLPESVHDLLLSIHIKQRAQKLGIQRIVLKNNILLAYLPDENSEYYNTAVFQDVLNLIHQNPKDIQLKKKEKNGKNSLYLRIDDVKSLQQVMSILELQKVS